MCSNISNLMLSNVGHPTLRRIKCLEFGLFSGLFAALLFAGL